MWEEWHSRVKGVIKGSDNKAMEITNYAEMKCSDNLMRMIDCYEA